MKKYFFLLAINVCLCTSACAPVKYGVNQEYNHNRNHPPSSTDILCSEFEITKRVLQLLETAVNRLDTDSQISKETFDEILEIVREFSDKCHQEKEDKVLFPFLKNVRENEKKDFLGQLLMEHVSSRDKIRDMSEALNNIYMGKKAKRKFTRIANGYIKHTKKHIYTEEKKLFPWMNEVLSHDEQAMLIKKFEDMEKADIDAGLHEKYIAMIERLEKQLGLYSE